MSAANGKTPGGDRVRRLILNPIPGTRSASDPEAGADPEASAFGRALADWRKEARRELGLDVERPIVASGHQTLMWHPGILVKYLLLRQIVERTGAAGANVIVDQHVGDFDQCPVPVTESDGMLGATNLVLCRPRPDVPMGFQPTFRPLPIPDSLRPATPEIRAGLDRMRAAIDAGRNAATNAACQMAHALDELMLPRWSPVPHVTASAMMRTTFAREVVRDMVRDPWACALAYNRAVMQTPDAGLRRLHVREDFVELPLWRISEDGTRRPADDVDAAAWLDGDPRVQHLMPRALMMTLIIRVALCDVFIHGLGGARYDLAMLAWANAWKGLDVPPGIVASADVHLHLPRRFSASTPMNAGRVAELQTGAHRIHHNPEIDHVDGSAHGPGAVKAEFLAAIASLPRGSRARRNAFRAMHRQLEQLRSRHIGRVEKAHREARAAAHAFIETKTCARRDWPFPFADDAVLDALDRQVAHSLDARGESLLPVSFAGRSAANTAG